MFVIWKISDNADFCQRYFTLVGEEIQQRPKVNAAQTHYKVGSSRITQEQYDTLAAEFDLMPLESWVPFEDNVEVS